MGLVIANGTVMAHAADTSWPAAVTIAATATTRLSPLWMAPKRSKHGREPCSINLVQPKLPGLKMGRTLPSSPRQYCEH